MAVPAIHPGEHVAEELRALNMTRQSWRERSVCQPIASRKFLMGHALLRPTPLCALLISLAPARSSGSICKVSMICGSPGRGPGNPSAAFPR